MRFLRYLLFLLPLLLSAGLDQVDSQSCPAGATCNPSTYPILITAGGTCVGGTTPGSCVVGGDTTHTLTDSFGAVYAFTGAANSTGTNYNYTRNGTAYDAGRIIFLDSTNKFWARITKGYLQITDGAGSFAVANNFTPTVVTASSTTASVAVGGSATALGISAPSDTVYAVGSLTIKADFLPTNGTVTLADGVTPVTVGQSLTSTQLTGLKVVPGSVPGNSSFGYTVTDPATTFAYGDVGISVTPTALWHDPANLATAAAGIAILPAFVQPSVAGDIVGYAAQNTSTTVDIASGWYTFAQYYRDGDVASTDVLVLRENGGTKHYCQRDKKATFPDATSRHDVLTCQFPAVTHNVGGTGSVDVMLTKCTVSCPAAPTAAPLAAALLLANYGATNEKATITFHPYTLIGADGTTATPSCATMLSGASPTWLSGAAVNEFDVAANFSDSSNGTVRVHCDIRAYTDGTTRTKMWLENSSTTSTRTDLAYGIVFGDGFTVGSTCSRATPTNCAQQYMYAIQSHNIYGGSAVIPVEDNGTFNLQFDTPYLVAAGALPQLDFSYGAQKTQLVANDDSIATNYTKVSTLAGFMSTGIFDLDMTESGGRSDIGPVTGWTSRYLVSQDPQQRYVVFGLSEAAGTMPMNLTEDATGKTVNTETNTDASHPFNGFPAAALNTSTPSSHGNKWVAVSPNHMPSTHYVPYLISGDEYELNLLQHEASFSIWFPSSGTYNSVVTYDSVHPLRYWSQGFSPAVLSNGTTGSYQGGQQVRSIAWETRDIAETAAITPDADSLKTHFLKELSYGLFGGNFQYAPLGPNIAGDNTWNVYGGGAWSGDFGALKGFVVFWSSADPQQGFPIPWHDDFLVSTLGMTARLNLPTVTLPREVVNPSVQARRKMAFMTNFTQGRFTNGLNGMDPFFGAFYNADVCLTDCVTGGVGGPPANTWAGLVTASNAYTSNATWDAGYGSFGGGTPAAIPTPGHLSENTKVMPLVCSGNSSSSAGGQGGYPEIATMSNATAFEILRSTQSLQAYAYVLARIPKCYSLSSNDMTADWRMKQQFNFVATMPDGKQIFTGPGSTQFQVDGTNAGTQTVTSTCGDNLLAIVGNGTATINGCNSGGYEVMAGDTGPTTMTAGTGANTWMFGGTGATTFIDSTGNNYMQAGAIATYASPSSSIPTVGVATYQTSTNASGKATIVNYRPGTDKVRISSAIFPNAAAFIAACSTSGGTTLCNMGGSKTWTLSNGVMPLVGDVTIF